MHATHLRDHLLKMRFMDHFVVRTTASLVSVPGLARERTLVFKWIGENTVTRKHPSLRSVTLWYGAVRFGEGTLARWWKDGETWVGASVDSPTEDDLGVLV